MAKKSFGLGIVSVKKPQFLDRLGGNLLGLPENFNALGVTEDDIMTALTGDSRNQTASPSRVLWSPQMSIFPKK